MSVGLEDVLGFQRFLLDSHGWPIDGSRHRIIVREKKDIADFLKLLAGFGKVGVDCGDVKSAQYVDVDVCDGHLVIWGSDKTSDSERALALVPDYLKIVSERDPRNSYAKLANNPLARLPEKAFEHEAFSPILFYPAHSLVPAGVSQVPQFVTASDKSELAMAIDMRMGKFFEYLGRRYPLVELLRKSTSMDDSFVYDFTILTASRPHENKRENAMYVWLDENIPFPVAIGHRVCRESKAGTNIAYTVSFQLPE